MRCVMSDRSGEDAARDARLKSEARAQLELVAELMAIIQPQPPVPVRTPVCDWRTWDWERMFLGESLGAPRKTSC